MGARGLRAVIEELMIPLMYELPAQEDVKAVTITPQFVRGESAALIERSSAAAKELTEGENSSEHSA